MASQTVDEGLGRGSGVGRVFQEHPAQGALQQDVVVGLAPSVPLGEDPRLCGSEELRVGLAAKGELAVAGLSAKRHANRFEQRVRLAIPRVTLRLPKTPSDLVGAGVGGG
ncbi:hypothetical protein ACH4TX_37270 [Streptomyces sp. NPDC021098]|uniref:hypothetical protein n=1 Tax=unclassified Streptomyces TaxID=2593676 RepID=UPI003796053B